MSFPDYEAFWSARYRDAGDDYLFGTAPNKFLASQAERLGAGMSVLAVAAGEETGDQIEDAHHRREPD